jgi:putative sterol carrier protein
VKRFATLKPLTRRHREDVGDALREMASLASKSAERGRIQLRLVRGEQSSVWTIELGGRAGKVTERASGKPNLELVTRDETWAQIAEGALSPLEAFLTGNLRIRGDAELGKRLVRHLAGDDGETEVCR